MNKKGWRVKKERVEGEKEGSEGEKERWRVEKKGRGDQKGFKGEKKVAISFSATCKRRKFIDDSHMMPIVISKLLGIFPGFVLKGSTKGTLTRSPDSQT